MNSHGNQSTILEMLAINEESISQLYITYANLFPEMREFWSDLADDEKLHATWIRILQQLSLNGKISFKSDRINNVSITAFSSRVKGEIVAATKTTVNLVDALSIAINIEENLIESRYFDSLETDSEDLKHTLRDLETATREHAQKLQDALDKHRLENTR